MPCIHAREDGFTIIEVMVAAVLLIGGMLGVVAMVDGANRTTAQARAREGATNLAREVVEQARAIPFDQLAQADLATRLQAMPGLAPAGAGAWKISRRGTEYNVETAVCTVDDPKDGRGDTSTGDFCPVQAAASDDPEPTDYKRVSADVSWTERSVTRRVKQTVLMSARGVADGPAIKTLAVTDPTVPSPDAPSITSVSVTAVTFRVTASSTATSVIWSRDGVEQGAATSNPDGSYSFTLPLAGLTDGGYEIGARAADAAGVSGPTRSITLNLVRLLPAAPTGVIAGPNTVRIDGTSRSVIELEWLANTERNVLGYRVYRPDLSLACPTTLTAVHQPVTCVDTSPSWGTYRVAAVFRGDDGALAEGTRTSVSVQQPSGTFYFTNQTTTPTATTCQAASSNYGMSRSFAGTSDTALAVAGNSLRFCSLGLNGTAIVPSGPTAVRATAHNSSNGTGQGCDVTAAARINSGTSVTATVTVPARTDTPQLFTWSLGTTAGYTLPSTDRLNVTFTGVGTGCNNTFLHVAGTAAPRSRLDIPVPEISPRPVTALTATPTAGGLELSWTAPATGVPVEFYRIYRDPPSGGSSTPSSADVEDRYDRVDQEPGQTAMRYTDPFPTGTSRYWVTAVSSTLSESTTVGPVTG